MNLSPDTPIKRSAEDRLNRSTFAEDVARRLIDYGVTESLVVGLLGPWGSGKTSLLNLVADALTRIADPATAPAIVWFDPWRRVEDTDLFVALMSTIAKATGTRQQVNSLKEVTRKAELLAKALRWGQGTPVVGKSIGRLAWLSEKASQSATALAAEAGKVEVLRDELREALTKIQRRLIIVVDDLDRLEPPDILQMMRIVKGLADLPMVTYLLAYDEAAMNRAIKSSIPGYDSAYLDKIVQIPIVVPVPERNLLDNLALGVISDVIRTARPRRYDDRRFAEIYVSGIRRYVNTIRDARRYGNAFSFAYGSLSKETNATDLIAVTALQVFEPALYSALPDQKDLLIDTPRLLFGREKNDSKLAADRLESFFSSVQINDRTAALSILESIFPKIEQARDEAMYRFEEAGDDTRIGSDRAFDRYFMYGVPTTQLTHEEYSRCFEAAKQDGDALIDALLPFPAAATTSFIEALQREDSSLIELNDRVRIAASLLEAANTLQEEQAPFPISLALNWRVNSTLDRLLSPENSEPSKWLGAFEGVLSHVHTAVSGAMTYGSFVVRVSLKGDVGQRHFDERSLESIRWSCLRLVERSLNLRTLRYDSAIRRTCELTKEWDPANVWPRLEAAIVNDYELATTFVRASAIFPSFPGLIVPRSPRYSAFFAKELLGPDYLTALISRVSSAPFLNDDTVKMINLFVEDSTQPGGPRQPGSLEDDRGREQ